MVRKTCLSDTRAFRFSKLALWTISNLELINYYSIDIKKCSLKVLKTLAFARDDAKTEILDNGVID